MDRDMRQVNMTFGDRETVRIDVWDGVDESRWLTFYCASIDDALVRIKAWLAGE